jgi:hypothetical protein
MWNTKWPQDSVATRRTASDYGAAGFAHGGDVTVAGAPGQRIDEGTVTVASRVEQWLAQVR